MSDSRVRRGDRGSVRPRADVNSLATTTRYIGAPQWWTRVHGKGIDVAVIDTGVSPVAGLRGPDKVVYGPDLSLESQAPNLTELDTYGHGTFMAGLIAGHDDGAHGLRTRTRPPRLPRRRRPTRGSSASRSATADGGTDVSQVVAAIDWAVQHAHDPGLNIRVLNLSYGTNSTQSYVSTRSRSRSSRRGSTASSSSLPPATPATSAAAARPASRIPAYDPFVIAVGASELDGHASARRTTAVAGFSASASGCGGVQGLPTSSRRARTCRACASRARWLDANHPGPPRRPYFRGSGTSQSAAITSGAVALVLSATRELTPDLVKRYLVDDRT